MAADLLDLTGSPTGSAGPVVGRLAPSPTGALHLGHARSFLGAWWLARAAGGPHPGGRRNSRPTT